MALTTFCDYDYADDTYDSSSDSYDCGAVAAQTGGGRIRPVPQRRRPETPDDDEAVVLVAYLRHRLRL